MKIYKALKEKNRLVKKINVILQKLYTDNSYIKGNKPSYKFPEKYNDLIGKINNLVELKSSIYRSNVKVCDKIFKLAELKGLVERIKLIPVKEGKVEGRCESVGFVEYESIITNEQKEKLIEEIENEIEAIQDELDLYNYKNDIK